MFIIRQAEKKDLFQIRKLLKEVGLNDRGIEEHLDHFFIAELPGGGKGMYKWWASLAWKCILRTG